MVMHDNVQTHGSLDEQGVRPLLTGVLPALARKHRVPGAQLAIHQDDLTVAIEVGELEFGARRRVSRESAFPIGSITKSFTATLTMVLAADGDLDLDAPVGDYLPELDNDVGWLTLRQVLSHTGGLPSGPDSEEVSTATARRYLLDHCNRHNLVLPPGTGFSYSNMGYVVAGWLIETVTGMSWWEATESILLRPLGIEPAFVGTHPAPPSKRRIATGHSVNARVGRTRPVRQTLAPAEAPTGGLAVSALDLVSLGLLHVGSGAAGVLPAAHAAQMRQPIRDAEPFGLADGWGLGLALFRHGSTEWVGHDGNADGTSCHLRIDPAGGWVIAFTSNANTGCLMWQDLLGELAHRAVPIEAHHAPASHGQPPAPPPYRCVGTYVNSDVEYLVAARNGGCLYLSVDGDDFALMTFHEGLTFSISDQTSGEPVSAGRFVRDPTTGRVDAIQLGGRLARRRDQTTRNASPRGAA